MSSDLTEGKAGESPNCGGPTSAPPALQGPPNGDADKIVDAIRGRIDAARAGDEHRRFPRTAWLRNLLVVRVDEGTGLGRRSRELQMVTHDISQGGLSFTFEQYISPGTVVRVFFDCLAGRPTLSGVVRNCIHLSGLSHRVGVQFQR